MGEQHRGRGGREATWSPRENKWLYSTYTVSNLALVTLHRLIMASRWGACLGLLKKIEMLCYLSYFIILKAKNFHFFHPGGVCSLLAAAFSVHYGM